MGEGPARLAGTRAGRTPERLALGVDADRFQPDLVLALGKPVEDVRIVDLPAGGATEYWRDEAGVHYVPKRALSSVLL